MTTQRWEDRITAEQEEVLRSVRDIAQGMLDDYVDTNRLEQLEAYVAELRALEEEFNSFQDQELEEEEDFMRREDESERIRAIESTQY